MALTHWGGVTHICVNKMGPHWFTQWLVSWLAPRHYLNQCWNIVNWTLVNKLLWNFDLNSNIFIHENAFECVVCKMAAILAQNKPAYRNHGYESTAVYSTRYSVPVFVPQARLIITQSIFYNSYNIIQTRAGPYKQVMVGLFPDECLINVQILWLCCMWVCYSTVCYNKTQLFSPVNSTVA